MTREQHLRRAADRGTQKAGAVQGGHQHDAVQHVLSKSFVEHFQTAQSQQARGTAMIPAGKQNPGETLLAHQGYSEVQASDPKHMPTQWKN
jgi:hypothetical protein